MNPKGNTRVWIQNSICNVTQTLNQPRTHCWTIEGGEIRDASHARLDRLGKHIGTSLNCFGNTALKYLSGSGQVLVAFPGKFMGVLIEKNIRVNCS